MTLVADDADQFVDDGGLLSLGAQDDTFVPANPTAGTRRLLRPRRDPRRSPTRGSTTTRASSRSRSRGTRRSRRSSRATPCGSSLRRSTIASTSRSTATCAQTVTATVPHTLSAMLADGTRMEGTGEWVRVAVTESGYELVDVLGEAAFIDAAAVESEDPTGDDAEFGTITAEDVVSDSVPARNGDDFVLYVDPLSGSYYNGGEALTPLVDSFTDTAGVLLVRPRRGVRPHLAAVAESVLAAAQHREQRRAHEVPGDRRSVHVRAVEPRRARRRGARAHELVRVAPDAVGSVARRRTRAPDAGLVELLRRGTRRVRDRRRPAPVPGAGRRDHQVPTSGTTFVDLGTFTVAQVNAQEWWVKVQRRRTRTAGPTCRAKAWLDDPRSRTTGAHRRTTRPEPCRLPAASGSRRGTRRLRRTRTSGTCARSRAASSTRSASWST